MNTPKQTQIALPKGFLLGAASSSHQVEGDNFYNDWWQAEKAGKVPLSGKGPDHYNRYEEDFQIAQGIGLNALRISIEWSRIEPEPDQYDMTEIEHYRKVLQSMKMRGLTPLITLHHFTLPTWAADKGGFTSNTTVQHFVKYAEFIARELGNEFELWNTINEPEVFTYMTSLRGFWPPFKRNPVRASRLYHNLAKAHRLAYQAIKAVRPNAQISIAKNNVYNEAYRSGNWLDEKAVQLNDWFGNYWFLNKIKNHLDFIGLNYYFYHSLTVTWKGVEHRNLEGPKSDMGWRTFPEGVYHLVKDLHHRYGKPIYITENGIANARDDMRQDFIRQHLYWCMKAIEEGVDVKGYFYWALTDNYEWSDGYDPKFGLVEINYGTFERKIRPSADVFKEITIEQ